jgi:hypothetical protein
MPAVPAVAVLSGNSMYGVLDEPVVAGFVSPERDANTFVPHVSVDRITRTAFVAAVPLVVQDSCRSQLIVKVQSVAWLSGPCKMNIPTAKLYFVISPSGMCDQHNVYPPNGVPAVAVPNPYTSYVLGVAFTCVAEKPVMFANDADAPHESEDAISRIWFEAAKPSPLS